MARPRKNPDAESLENGGDSSTAKLSAIDKQRVTQLRATSVMLRNAINAIVGENPKDFDDSMSIVRAQLELVEKLGRMSTPRNTETPAETPVMAGV